MTRSWNRRNRDNLGVSIMVWALLVLGGETTGRAAGCDLYPIALSAQSLAGKTNGSTFDIFQGGQPGNFGWLSWGGSPSEDALVKSLTAPGNSWSYVNPDNPQDHQIEVRKWMRGKPGVSNSKAVRQALDGLIGMEILVPVWDSTRGQGAGAAYRFASLATVKITGYHLPQQNRITVQYLGGTSCSNPNQAPVVSAGSDQTITLPNIAFLHGVVRDDGFPSGALLTSSWSVASGPGAVTFSNATSSISLTGGSVTNEVNATASFAVPGTYILMLRALDSQLQASNTVIITVDRPNQAPIAHSQMVALNQDTSTNIILTGSDPENDSISFAVATLPNYGTLSGTPPHLTYTPALQYSGPDSFTFTVNDGRIDSAPAIVSIDVRHINMRPVADVFSVTNLENASIPILLSGSDVEGSNITYRVVQSPTNGTLEGAVPSLVYTPTSNFFGSDTLIYVVNDGETDSAPAVVEIIVQPVDEPPIVFAGLDQFIVLPTNAVSLVGQVTYDIFPGAVDTVEWSKVSGPGQVTFSNPTNTATTVSFTQSGIYQLQLMASDAFLSSTSSLTVTVDAPPSVFAGNAQTSTFPANVTLNGYAFDDGIPTNAVLDIAWSKVSGPGTVIFSDAAATNASASFSEPGIYVLKLTAGDGASSSSSLVTNTVNQAPIVDAGPAQIITNLQTTLLGSVFDDGLPSGVQLISWTQVEGPGTATFFNSNASATVVTFSETGIYRLRLAASDSLVTNFDDILISVDGAPVINLSGDSLINFPLSATVNAQVVDDGLPENATLSYHWEKMSGQGDVAFSNVAAQATAMTFSTSGVYVVSFSASDTLISASTNWTIVVNAVPSVAAGTPQTITLPENVTLNGTVSDDGLPTGSLGIHWSKLSGPGDVLFASSTNSSTTASFNTSGIYVLQLSAADGAATNNSSTTVTVNTAPSVDAGPDQTISSVSVSASLTGNVTDDGLPAGNLTVNWAKVSGPGAVLFGNGAAAVTTATFDAPGVYVLQLTANDGVASRSDTLTVVVNQGPSVALTTPSIITWPSNQFVLQATVTDDGFPNSSILSSGWSKVSGPGTVQFSPATQTTPLAGSPVNAVSPTTATVSVAGQYVLRLTINDGITTNFADVSVTVNQAPIVNAGTDKTNTLPNNIVILAGTVTDDGLPVGNAIITTWSKESGPGVVLFNDPSAANTTATFETNGTYILKLLASDGVSTNSSTLSVVINQATVVVVDAVPVITWPSNQVLLTGSLTDDGLPVGSTLNESWSQVNGPGVASFSPATGTISVLGSPITTNTSSTATFSAPGLYTVRLTVTDGLTTNSAETKVTVNQAPIVSAGADKFIVSPANQTTLNGNATDDGLPEGSSLTVSWTKVSGPGQVAFANPNALATSASFTSVGSYVLNLVASDGVSSNASTVTVVVDNAPTASVASVPVITWPTNQVVLNGIATDDGLPIGKILNQVWSQVSGPGAATFTNPRQTRSGFISGNL